MEAPWAASSRTTAFPIPLLPPVTMATLPASVMVVFSFCRSGVLGWRGEDQMRDQSGPAGLMCGAEAHSGVAVEVLVERDVVLPSGVGGQQVVPAVDRAPTVPSG